MPRPLIGVDLDGGSTLEDYNAYLADHPNFNIEDAEQAEEMWDYFKSIGCYDEPEDSVDLHNTIVELEIV